MRGFLTYFNALLLGVILGMIALATLHEIPPRPQDGVPAGEVTTGQRTITISISLARLLRDQSCAVRRQLVRFQSGR